MTDKNLLFAQRLKLQNFEKGFVGMYLLHIGIQLGLFHQLKDMPDGLTPVELANELDLLETCVETWCRTAYHLKILNCDEQGRFSLDPCMEILLTDIHSPHYTGHTIEFMTCHLAKLLKHETERYRKNNRFTEDDRGRDYSRCTRATTDQGVHIAYNQVIIPSIPEMQQKLSTGARVLDVGCGSGMLMIELARVYSASTFIGLEIDKYAFDDARKNIVAHKLTDRIMVKLNNAADVVYNQEFDLITMAFSLHEIAIDIREKTIENCYRALKKYGVIAIFDFAYPDKLQDFKNPLYSPGILDQFPEVSWGGSTPFISHKNATPYETRF